MNNVAVVAIVLTQLVSSLFTAALIMLVYYLFVVRAPRQRANQRAEDKVRLSAPILREDIEILSRMNSRLLDDAVSLRRSQVEQEA